MLECQWRTLLSREGLIERPRSKEAEKASESQIRAGVVFAAILAVRFETKPIDVLSV